MIHRNFVSLFLFPVAIQMSCAEEKAPEPVAPRPVKYTTIGAGNADHARSFPATVQPRDATQLSFRVGGTLATLSIKMGGRVKKGQQIASLDSSDYRVALAQAKASSQNAKTARDTAKSAFERVERLFEAGGSSQSNYEAAKGQNNSAQAQLALATQQVKQANNQLSYTDLRAPFDGVVNSVSVKQGEAVSPGRTIAVVSRGGELEVTVGVPEDLVSRVKIGTPAVVTVSALSKTQLKASVREVGFVSQNSTYPVRIQLDALPPTLRPGMTAQVRFAWGPTTTEVVVPTSGVGNSEDGTFVFLLEPAQGGLFTVRKTKIVLGKILANTFEVTQGLKAGDKVATAGMSNLLDGLTVRLLEPSR